MRYSFGTKQYKITISVLLFAVIVLAGVLLARMQDDVSSRRTYVIGSPVTPAAAMPAGMTMKTFDLMPGEAVPTIAFTAVQDSMGGWDIHVVTTHFTFTPEHIDGVPVAGEGHVHLYIDNTLIIMLGTWYHIDSLTPGMHTIRVGLFNNDHSAYAINGKNIEAEQTLSVGNMKMSGM